MDGWEGRERKRGGKRVNVGVVIWCLSCACRCNVYIRGMNFGMADKTEERVRKARLALDSGGCLREREIGHSGPGAAPQPQLSIKDPTIFRRSFALRKTVSFVLVPH